MATFRTSAGRSVGHCHVGPNPKSPCRTRDWTAAQRRDKRADMAADFPNVVEVLPPSRKYNCFGYAYTGSHAWFNYPDFFIADDFSEVSMKKAQLLDVLVYEDDEGELTHAAFVEEIKSGEITKVRSKWGKVAVVIHEPTDVPEDYGQAVRLLRRNA